MIVEVKQIGKFKDRDNKASYGEYTMFPFSSRTYTITKGLNNRYKTGLEKDDKKREEFEEVFGESLANNAPFWKGYRITFRMPEGSMKFNTENPEEELKLIVAQANHLLAPDIHTLRDDHKFKRNTIFYIHNEEDVKQKENLLFSTQDEISGIMYGFRNNKEKLLFICYALGLFVNDGWRVEDLYMTLYRYKEESKNLEKLQIFRDILKTPNEQLQSSYYTKQALKTGIIIWDSASNKYRFLDKFVGKAESEVVGFFSDKKNEASLAALISEVKDKQRS